MEELLFDRNLLPGFSESGAHLLNMAFYDVNLRALHIAQKRGEKAVARMVERLTSEPAAFLGVSGVGRVAPGMQADLVLLDPDALAAYDGEASVTEIYRDALEHEQLVNRSDGVVVLTLVHGKVAWSADGPGEALGNEKLGSVLRA